MAQPSGALPRPARPGLSIPQEVALHFCAALHGLQCSLPSPNHPWSPAVTKVGGAGAPASCLPGKDRSPWIPMVSLELMGKSSAEPCGIQDPSVLTPSS